MKIVVTGMGIVSAIGGNLAANLQSLREGRTGLGKPQYFETAYADTFPFGEVKCSNDALLSQLHCLYGQGLTRTDLLAMQAFQEAIRDADLQETDLRSRMTAFISASTVGGMCLTDQLYADANRESNSSEFLSSYPAAAHTLQLIRAYQLKGFTDTLNTACSSSLNAIILGCRLIQSGRAQRAIVGGVDSLAKYTVNGFNALSILSKQACRSFDANRDGLNLGEAGAYLVLEAEEVAQEKKKYCKISGYGNACDAFHASALSEEAIGVKSAIQLALNKAVLDPSQIDFIHTHGTATENNDFVESRGMKEVFKEKVPPFISTKTYTGHTLGAAGAVGAVYTALALANQEIYPSLNFSTPTVENLVPHTRYQSMSLQYALTSAFGFGGNCSSLILEHV